jgi:hypothetical protein
MQQGVLPSYILGTRLESCVPRSQAGSCIHHISLEPDQSLLFPRVNQEVLACTSAYLWKPESSVPRSQAASSYLHISLEPDQSLLFPRVKQEVLSITYLWNRTRVLCSQESSRKFYSSHAISLEPDMGLLFPGVNQAVIT